MKSLVRLAQVPPRLWLESLVGSWNAIILARHEGLVYELIQPHCFVLLKPRHLVVDQISRGRGVDGAD